MGEEGVAFHSQTHDFSVPDPVGQGVHQHSCPGATPADLRQGEGTSFA